MAYQGGAYTAAELHYVGSLMAQKTGLDAGVCTTWAQAEQGYGFNPYGVSKPGTVSTRADFPNVEAAVTEAARWVNTFGNYANIRANRGKSKLAQAYAIAASPWGPTGYYFRAFPTLGLAITQGHPPADWSSASAPAGSVGAATPPTGSSTSPATGVTPTTPQTPQAAIAAFLGKSVTDRLTSSDVDKIAAKLAHDSGVPDILGSLTASFRLALQPFIGQPISSITGDPLAAAARAVGYLAEQAGAGAGVVAGAAADVAGEAIAAALGAVIPFVVGAGVLIVVVMLASGGARDVLG